MRLPEAANRVYQCAATRPGADDDEVVSISHLVLLPMKRSLNWILFLNGTGCIPQNG